MDTFTYLDPVVFLLGRTSFFIRANGLLSRLILFVAAEDVVMLLILRSCKPLRYPFRGAKEIWFLSKGREKLAEDGLEESWLQHAEPSQSANDAWLASASRQHEPNPAAALHPVETFDTA
jgi:hypothetical protein